jgi:hypothetical protein
MPLDMFFPFFSQIMTQPASKKKKQSSLLDFTNVSSQGILRPLARSPSPPLSTQLGISLFPHGEPSSFFDRSRLPVKFLDDILDSVIISSLPKSCFMKHWPPDISSDLRPQLLDQTEARMESMDGNLPEDPNFIFDEYLSTEPPQLVDPMPVVEDTEDSKSYKEVMKMLEESVRTRIEITLTDQNKDEKISGLNITNSEFDKIRKKFDWIILVSAGVGCKFCAQDKKIIDSSTKCQARKYRQCNFLPENYTALYNSAKAHHKADYHLSSVLAVCNQANGAIQESLRKSHGRDLSQVAVNIRILHLIALKNISFTTYPVLLELMDALKVEYCKDFKCRQLASSMIKFMGNFMRRKALESLVKEEPKINLLIDESSTSTNRGTLICYIRAGSVSHFVGVVELENGSAGKITDSIFGLLARHGLSKEFLAENLVGITTDGAAVMTGKNSGVTQRIKDELRKCNPGFACLVYHCMNHRVELALKDCLKGSSAVDAIRKVADQIYKYYNYPKRMTELRKSAELFHLTLVSLPKLLDIRWCSSMYMICQSLWRSLEAIVTDLERRSSQGNLTEEMTKILKQIRSEGFLRSLAAMLDIHKLSAILSLELQKTGISISTAFEYIERYQNGLLHLDSNKESYSALISDILMPVDSSNSTVFFGTMRVDTAYSFPLIDVKSLANKLHHCMEIRKIDKDENFKKASAAIGLFSREKLLAEALNSKRDKKFGYNEMKDFCEVFRLNFAQHYAALEVFFLSNNVSEKLKSFIQMIETFTPSTAQCERGFSIFNSCHSKERSNLHIETIDCIMAIKHMGGTVASFDPEPIAKEYV